MKTFEDVLQAYLTRRGFLKSVGVVSASACVSHCGYSTLENSSSLTFSPVNPTAHNQLQVAKDYQSQVLIRWGDPLFNEAPEFDPLTQTAAKQKQQFGYNNDYVGFLPLPFGSEQTDHGLLMVNHEYTNPELMFPGSPSDAELTQDQTDIDIAAHGLSIIEIKREGNQWEVVKSSPYNRRITPETPMNLTGAAAGHERLKSLISKEGVETIGTFSNCSGCVTPWGTLLTGEENVDEYFLGDHTQLPEAKNYERFGMSESRKHWGDFYDRWNLEKNPQGLLHSGWIVEIDPYNPHSIPKKRTGLGRFKHEGANIFINKDKRAVIYCGDDQQFEYIYKFVSKGKYDDSNRQANMDLLTEGTLYVAHFLDNGTLKWLPLIYGQGPLNKDNGFGSQADVLLDTRRAADLLGATPMDRPEDVEVNPSNGKVYAMLTNNSGRTEHQLDAANPRAHNQHGQIIEFWPEDGDHTKNVFQWELFLLAGNPEQDITLYHPDLPQEGWLSCPDNCAFDPLGNLWIATDGAENAGIPEGLWATEVSGKHRALTKRFMAIPKGAEMCGPFFTKDGKNLFCSVQHPASGSTYETPSTRWPDFSNTLPPRPAVVVTRNNHGKRIGS
ncbi:PhoX family protein [Marinibactrum halimedae]|uniref:dTDP-glucose 4,6-dehydratase n=1 Tax=Marinibactrum halimedae TaxID=1444977 RepID=A0AA37WNN6_9GAMM|nr:PhoX family phosphatase [Marinibactrum halimedae]MCD9458843.1 PhoX family phosphatase [Marinibactrum halimedae]GLS27695.1 dTDP-glucose 4,6-dehydratase [Marinibactrum halimedae]